MASTSALRIVGSDNELQKLVALIEDVDSVELKVDRARARPSVDRARARSRARAFLTSRGVDLDANQQTKTRTALEFLARGP
jgi:hypothetical protein